jgi:hypothetical protein
MFGARKLTKQQTTEYAMHADFCRIFATDTKGLYLLSFLLTGDHTMAERCFVGGLEDSTEGNAVFKEWARSWARRKIIENAISMLRPTLNQGESPADTLHDGTVRVVTERPEISVVIALAPFERFVFVMSVLEGYSDYNCSLLLACTRAAVTAARTRALRDIGISAERISAEIQRELIKLSEQANQFKADSPKTSARSDDSVELAGFYSLVK